MAGKRAALIIATGSYSDPLLDALEAPAQDAEHLARVLGDPKIGDFEVVTMLDEASYNVNRAVEDFLSDRARDDLLLIYFSCHGLKDELGRLYYATTDTRHNRPVTSAVPASLVNDLMSNSRCRRQILLLDCCYSGAFARGMVMKGDKTISTRERFEGRGRAIITASDSMQYAFEGDAVTGEGRVSLFTSVLVNGLETGRADLDGDGWVDLDELFEYVAAGLLERRADQRPKKWMMDVDGKLLIGRTTPSRPAPEWFHSDVEPLAEEQWEYLIEAIREKRCLPVIGPGIHPAMFSDDAQLARRLALTIEYPGEESSKGSEVAQYIESLLGRETLMERYREWLARVPIPDLADTDEPLCVLAALALPMYMTTNQDDSLGKTLAFHGRDPIREAVRGGKSSVFNDRQDLSPTPATPLVMHLFGHTDLAETLVITEDDIEEFFSALLNQWGLLPAVVMRALRRNTLLFTGFTLQDPRFERILKHLLNASVVRHSPAAFLQLPKSDQRKYLTFKTKGSSRIVHWGESRKFLIELRRRLEGQHWTVQQ